MTDGRLEKGTVLKGADSGKKIVVGDYVGGGSQGDVYRIDYDGELKALKWYRDPTFVPKKLNDVLTTNAQKGSPGDSFMWPIEATEYKYVSIETEHGNHSGETFGYVMDLIPEGYYSFEDFLLARQHFASYRVAVDACLEISKVFRVLRIKGLCYQDLNAGNFFFNPKNGDVVICDCDNVADHGVSTGIIGTPGFMAPELVIDDWEYMHDKDNYRDEFQKTGKRRVQPSYKTDRFSMAVVFFEILTNTNPLAGRRSFMPQDSMVKVHLYGYDALFMFDSENSANAPDPIVHKTTIDVWNALPSYMQKIFRKAFSHDAITNPNMRVPEGEWIDALVRLRADIFTCPVCNSNIELFTDSAAETRCSSCGRKIKSPLVFVFPNGVRTPAVPGTRIYRTQMGPTGIGEELDPVAVMLSKNNAPSDWRQWGVMNCSKQDCVASVRGSGKHTFANGQVVPVGPDLEIEVFGAKVKVDTNNG